MSDKLDVNKSYEYCIYPISIYLTGNIAYTCNVLAILYVCSTCMPMSDDMLLLYANNMTLIDIIL